MWIFGYGSLVWKVDFPYKSKLTGFIKGYTRKFYQGSTDHRGTPCKPGRVVTLLPSTDPEDRVWGIAYELHEANKDDIMKHLDFREKNGYEKVMVTFHPANLNERPFELSIYVATADNDHYAGMADIDSIARIIVDSSGMSGTNREYLYQLASAMRLLAPHHEDDHLYELEAAVKRLEITDEQQTNCDMES
ncbi:putative glutathione-specific gamma-glutamylcyclotransferase 2 [Nilaparvata lugens]|uniref:putative glutathione-specific gamma-glutamylcyclotransferase 2 n=1 Tax=Nilaparvata lugens TaxID=108931 RepID=UPI00193DC3FE|nr:putative glutathione-specific gamma-glutamylcyclotransferase 2 [Nilaparvata lugens]